MILFIILLGASRHVVNKHSPLSQTAEDNFLEKLPYWAKAKFESIQDRFAPCNVETKLNKSAEQSTLVTKKKKRFKRVSNRVKRKTDTPAAELKRAGRRKAIQQIVVECFEAVRVVFTLKVSLSFPTFNASWEVYR